MAITSDTVQPGAPAHKLLAVLGSVVAVLASPLMMSSPAYAGINCQPSSCLSVLQGTGTTFHGLYMTQRQANLTLPSYQSPPSPYYHINSSMWLMQDLYFAPWVEMGLTYTLDNNTNTMQYEAYYAWYKSNGFYKFNAFQALSPDGTLDAFQISRGSAVNTWQLQWAVSGQPWQTWQTTDDTGFWSGQGLQMGGEVYSYNGHADTFNMNSLALNSNNIWSKWGTQGGWITDSQLNGFSYSNSEWSWNTVN